MSIQANEARSYNRFPFKATVTYSVMSDNFHLPWEISATAETVDLSEYGVRLCLRDWVLKEGSLLVIRLPISETQTTVPTLAQVRWVKQWADGIWHAGLSFVL